MFVAQDTVTGVEYALKVSGIQGEYPCVLSFGQLYICRYPMLVIADNPELC